MLLFLIQASRDGRHWLVQHFNAGVAVFHSRSAAERHVESIAASGVNYQILALHADLA